MIHSHLIYDTNQRERVVRDRQRERGRERGKKGWGERDRVRGERESKRCRESEREWLCHSVPPCGLARAVQCLTQKTPTQGQIYISL
jgi:hypothetical protein